MVVLKLTYEWAELAEHLNFKLASWCLVTARTGVLLWAVPLKLSGGLPRVFTARTDFFETW